MGISNLSTGLRPGVCTSTTRPSTPFEGQMIYETDTNRVLVYEGAAWVMIADTDTPPALQLISAVTFNNEASKVVDNVFSADYTNYKVVVELYGSSNSNIVFFRLINETGTERTTNYYASAWGVDYASGPTTLYSSGARSTDMPIGYASNTSNGQPLVADLLIGNPWSTGTRTALAGPQTGLNDGVVFLGGSANGAYLTKERHRGFWVRNTANTGLYGSVRVYGYRD